MESFIERAPAETVVVSIDQVPPVPPKIDQLVGVPDPDSKDPLGTKSGIEVVASRRKKPEASPLA